MNRLNHELKPYHETSIHYFICNKCQNLIHHQFDEWWYYLNKKRDMFVPLEDCNEMIIKELLE